MAGIDGSTLYRHGFHLAIWDSGSSNTEGVCKWKRQGKVAECMLCRWLHVWRKDQRRPKTVRSQTVSWPTTPTAQHGGCVLLLWRTILVSMNWRDTCNQLYRTFDCLIHAIECYIDNKHCPLNRQQSDYWLIYCMCVYVFLCCTYCMRVPGRIASWLKATPH